MEDLETLVNSNLKLLPTESITNPRLAEQRSAQLLLAVAQLHNEKRKLLDAKMKAVSELTVVQHNAMAQVDAKTITEKKNTAEASGAVIMARESLEKLDNQISYIKGIIDVFNNGSVLLRQMSRGEI